MLFDCDGTLVDTASVHATAWASALEAHGIVQDPQWFRSRAGLSSADVLAALAEEVPGLPAPAVDIVRRRHLAQALGHVRAVAVVSQLAQRLVAAGTPVAVASGGSRDNVTASLAAAGLQGLFTVVVTREDAPRGKPAPDLFLVAAQRLGVEPAGCLVYEDSPEGLAAAAAAGMRSVDVRPYTSG